MWYFTKKMYKSTTFTPKKNMCRRCPRFRRRKCHFFRLFRLAVSATAKFVRRTWGSRVVVWKCLLTICEVFQRNCVNPTRWAGSRDRNRAVSLTDRARLVTVLQERRWLLHFPKHLSNLAAIRSSSTEFPR